MSPNLKEHFAKLGFNIFLTTPVSDIPESIYSFNEIQKKKTLIIIGAGGPELWEKIPDKSIANFLDNYSLKALEISPPEEILFPHENIIFPLQKISRFLNFSHQSPIGLDISENYGLWFSFRAAVLIDKEFEKSHHASFISPCTNCSQKPCLNEALPYISRSACPYKNDQHYTLAQIDYHFKIYSELNASMQHSLNNK